jgi:DNA-binding PadR family transcriptional regulator
MSSSQGHRQRRAARAKQKARQGRPRFNIRDYPDTPPPALGTVRTWLNQCVTDGNAEKAVLREGKRGRPPYGYRLTEAGKARLQRTESQP